MERLCSDPSILWERRCPEKGAKSFRCGLLSRGKRKWFRLSFMFLPFSLAHSVISKEQNEGISSNSWFWSLNIVVIRLNLIFGHCCTSFLELWPLLPVTHWTRLDAFGTVKAAEIKIIIGRAIIEPQSGASCKHCHTSAAVTEAFYSRTLGGYHHFQLWWRYWIYLGD